MMIPNKVTFSAHVVPVARMLKILPKLLVLLRDAHATITVKLVQGNVAATIARMKTSLNSLDQAVLKRADVSNGGPCACGKNSNKEDTDRVSYKDGKRKTKCPCATEGIGCTEKCKCRNCGNTIQTGGVSTALGTGRKRRETVSSYKRKCGTEFLTSQNVSVAQGPWRLMETLCLIVCTKVSQDTQVRQVTEVGQDTKESQDTQVGQSWWSNVTDNHRTFINNNE